MSASLLRLVALIASTLAVLVVKAFLPFPIMQRGIAGSGLYHHLNRLQFQETALVTFLVILLLCWRRFGLAWPQASIAALACALMNFGLMVIDARWQTFPDWIEQNLLERYGPPALIWAIGLAALCVGGTLLGLVWHHTRLGATHAFPDRGE
jgi:uncharacterized membrane-anchored protein YitT (DUF2179 family)